jgi:hypothetical protein
VSWDPLTSDPLSNHRAPTGSYGAHTDEARSAAILSDCSHCISGEAVMFFRIVAGIELGLLLSPKSLEMGQSVDNGSAEAA